MIIETSVSSTAAEIANLSNQVDEILTGLRTEVSELLTDLQDQISNSLGAVKSIQRGVAKGVNSYSNQNIVIIINQVNPDKCMVILNDKFLKANNLYKPMLVSLTDTELTVTPGGYLDPSFMASDISWQVIEFY